MNTFSSYPLRAYKLAGFASLIWSLALFLALYSSGTIFKESIMISVIFGAILFLIYIGRIFGTKLQISGNKLTYYNLLRKQSIELDKLLSCQYKLRNRGFANPAYWVCYLEDSRTSINFPANVWRNNDELRKILKEAANKPGILINDNAKSQLEIITTL